MARFEWLWLEILLMAVLVWELVRTRRSIRRDREAREAAKIDPPPPPP